MADGGTRYIRRVHNPETPSGIDEGRETVESAPEATLAPREGAEGLGRAAQRAEGARDVSDAAGPDAWNRVGSTFGKGPDVGAASADIRMEGGGVRWAQGAKSQRVREVGGYAVGTENNADQIRAMAQAVREDTNEEERAQDELRRAMQESVRVQSAPEPDIPNDLGSELETADAQTEEANEAAREMASRALQEEVRPEAEDLMGEIGVTPEEGYTPEVAPAVQVATAPGDDRDDDGVSAL